MKPAAAPADNPPADAERAAPTADLPQPRTAAEAPRAGTSGEVPAPRAEPVAPGVAVPAPAAPVDPALSEREREILAFEQRWWKHAGAKEQAIRDTFDLSATRYYQILNGLLDNPAALEADPVLVSRLRRLRSTRTRHRRR